MDALQVYIPIDRLQALIRGEPMPDRVHGAALFADISGFTPLTEALVGELGPQRGAEELTRQLDRVYDALIGALNRYGGSVIGFSGDAITCWLDGDDGPRATASAHAMQAAMAQFAAVRLPSGRSLPLAMKATVAAGQARRFMVGHPSIQVIDVLCGAVLDRLAAAEHLAARGEVLVDATVSHNLGDGLSVSELRADPESGERFAVTTGLAIPVKEAPWPDPGMLSEKITRSWLLPPVYERLRHGMGDFLAELRPAAALFLRFGGIDYDQDPDAGRKLDHFIRRVQTVLSDLGGWLLQLTIGDKGSYLYAAFGAPLAHEDDPARALSAALRLRELDPKCQIGASLGSMRTGAYGSHTRRTYGVLGDETNLAARLMQAASPGEILASHTLRRAAGSGFEWGKTLSLQVKGKAAPVPASVLNDRKAQRAIRLQEPRYALPMVGRTDELALIAHKIDLTLQGRGQVVAITGEAGIGKSRLVAEAIRLVGEKGVSGYGGEAQSYGVHSSYLVWQPIWQAFFNLDPVAKLQDKALTLEKRLRAIDPRLAARAPLLGPVLSLALPDNDLTRDFDAKLRKSSLEALLVDCLAARARQQPVLLVLEDLHWIDPLSRDLLEVIARAAANLPVLLLLDYRPSQRPGETPLPVTSMAHFTEISLAEFSLTDARQLIRLKLNQFLGQGSEPAAPLVEEITRHAEGNPFYIEELLNYLHDRNVDLANPDAIGAIQMPTSLQSLILSRIDQCTESQKTTLKLASVIGRLFNATWLWGSFSQLGNEARVRADLEILDRAELTQLDSPEPELTYLFKHIVTQEVAYESLPFATRSVLHGQLAAYIEERSGLAVNQALDLLAFHYGLSEVQDKKCEYLLKAGDAAQARYANPTAIDYYRRVLELLPSEEQGAVMLKLGRVYATVGEVQEAEASYQSALHLAEEADDLQALGWVCAAEAELLGRLQGRYAEAGQWLDKASTAFDAIGDLSGKGQVLHQAGTFAAQQGEYASARQHYEESLSIRSQLGDDHNISNLLSNLAILARFEGNAAQARELHLRALNIRRELGDKWAIAISLNNLGKAAMDDKDYQTARNYLEEGLTLLREVGDRFYIANATNNLANVLRQLGEYGPARELYRESLGINFDLGALWAIAYLLEDIGGLAALEMRPEHAIKLDAAASQLRETIGAPLPPVEAAALEELLAPARAALSEQEREKAQATGKAMSLDTAVHFALDFCA